MSWSFSGIGKPAALATALDAYGTQISGQSKEEFDSASVALKGLLSAAQDDAAVSIIASGHASFRGGVRTSAYIDVTVKQLGKLYE